MNDHGTALMKCSTCDTPIDECAFCEEPDCRTPICYECLNVALGQALPQPHVHGG